MEEELPTVQQIVKVMGSGMWLFKRRKKKKNIEAILEQVTDDVLSPQDKKDEKKVQHYILEHCEQLIESAKDLEQQKSEYRIVTSYLKDIQVIEELSEKEQNLLKDTASNIITLNQSREDYLQTTKKLTDTQYAQMQQNEEDITTAIRTLQANEKYQSAVKRDMQYLEGEKTEWIYYRQELANEQGLLRRLAFALFGVLLMLLSVILVLQVGFEMDTKLLLMILIAAGAVGGAAILLRMQKNTTEMKKAEINTNHAISLLNKTKIKYVHATNAVDYACEKYHVRNSYELNYLWEQYMEAKREQEKFERTSDDLEYFQGKLVRMLRRYELYDARVWVTQTHALIDKREMVEIKHDLLERRQKLRERIEYLRDVVLDQKQEVEELMKKLGGEIPEVREIVNSVNKLCGLEQE